MKLTFPHFRRLKKTAQLTKQDERVFAEASELAQLRLEQCIGDQHICRGADPFKSMEVSWNL
jgi:hypothetical protein